MLDDVAVSYGSHFFVAAGGVALALLCLFLVLWFIRNRAPSPFVRGGKNRQPRLQVLDAAAVDARRRLVLVRRDGIEHLIMIGGPTDIVIESGIDPTRAAATATAAVAAAPSASFDALTTSQPLSFARPEPTQEPPRIVASQQPSAPQPRQEEPEPADDLYTPAVVRLAPPQRPEPAVDLDSRRKPPQPVERPRPVAPPLEVAPPQEYVPEPVVAERAEEIEAADALDAVRHRVLPPQPERQPRVSTPAAQSMPVVDHGAPVTPKDSNIRPIPAVASADPAVDIQPPVREPSLDFQSVLEEEMSQNLTAERIVSNAPMQNPRQQPPVQSPRRDPELPPITGADSALQKEVARIFGEMSVNRDR
jgi:hypothetical protein